MFGGIIMDFNKQVQHIKSILNEIEKLNDHDRIFEKTQDAIDELQKILDDIRPGSNHVNVIQPDDPF